MYASTKISFRYASLGGMLLLLGLSALLLHPVDVKAEAAEDAPESFTKGEEANSDVVDLEEEEFDAYIAKHEPVIVMFFAPNCGFCKKMKPAYEEAATKLKEMGFAGKVARVDGTENSELVKKHDIQGYPTVKLFHEGEITDYHGGRTAEEIVKWFSKMTGPSVKVIQNEKEADYEGLDAYFIGTFLEKDTPAFENYAKAASKRRAISVFYAILSPTADNSVVAYRANEGQVKYTGSTDEDFEEFVDTESFPLLSILHPGNFESFLKRKLDFAWLDGTQQHYDDYGAVLREVAPHFRKTLSFVWVNSDLYVPNGEAKGAGPKFMLNLLNGTRYALENPQVTLKDAAIVKKFIEDAQAGIIPHFVKSEPIPEKNDEPVKVIVGDSFVQEVFHTDKDVMLEVYAPWCGHCKAFEPVYKKLAEKLQGVSNIVIAKMDGTSNESPDAAFEWKAYPTIFFVKAGNRAPIMYEGDRQMEDLIAFINEHGSKAIDLPKEEL